jgi:hypothetical protein
MSPKTIPATLILSTVRRPVNRRRQVAFDRMRLATYGSPAYRQARAEFRRAGNTTDGVDMGNFGRVAAELRRRARLRARSSAR